MQIRVPPPSASIASAPDETGKLHAPSAARNRIDLCAAIKSIAPQSGTALEIASGTGQHIVTFADAMPDITWQPSEIDSLRLASISAYISQSSFSNISPPIALNATQSGWANDIAAQDLIVLVNLLHLISEAEAKTLIVEAANALLPAGRLCLYGPFMRQRRLTSEGDARFDASIRAVDPDIGYKDDAWVTAVAAHAGFDLTKALEMPANNLLLCFRKPV
jgi:hypothetical protein